MVKMVVVVFGISVLWILLLIQPNHAKLTGIQTAALTTEDESADAVRSIITTTSEPHCTVVSLAHHLNDNTTTHAKVPVVWWAGSVVLMTADNTTLPHTLSQIAKLRVKCWCMTVVVSSDHLDFFTAFAIQAKATRLLVWGTRLLLVTNLPSPQVNRLLTDHWTFSMMNTLLLNHRPHLTPPRYELLVHLPYSAQGPGVAKVATWEKGRRDLSLHTNYDTLFPDKYSNFHGSMIPVTALILPPFWKVVNATARNTWDRFSGRDCLIMKAVAQALNFTFHMVKSSNIDEIMSSLESGRALLSGFRIMLIPQILARVDHTFFIDRATFTFVMARPSTRPQWQSIYYPLGNEVWLGILALTVLVPPVMYMLTYMEGDKHVRTNLKARSIFLETVAILLGQDIWIRLPRGDGTRLLVVLWLIFGFIMGTAYRGTLTAFLSVPKYPSRPENMEELAQAGVRSMFTQNATRFLVYFKESKLPSYHSVASRVDIVPTVMEGLKQVSQENVAFFHERYNSELRIAEHFSGSDGSPHLLYVAKENVIPNYAAWMMPHDSPYKHNVDRWIVNIIESGLKEKYTEDMMREAWQAIRKKKEENKEVEEGDVEKSDDGNNNNNNNTLKPLSLLHLQGAVWLMILGLVMATFSFLVEIICTRNI